MFKDEQYVTKQSIAAQVMIHSLPAAPVDMALIKRFGHVTHFSWQDKQEVNPSHSESRPDSSSFLFLTLYAICLISIIGH